MHRLSNIARLMIFAILVASLAGMGTSKNWNGSARAAKQEPRVEMEKSVLIQPTGGLVTTENGTSVSFNVSLSEAPSAPVKIPLQSSDTTEGVLSTSQVNLSQGNWQRGADVTITGVDDNIVDGDIPYTILTGPTQSSDPGYNGLDPLDVSVINLDNDTPPTAVPDNDITDEDMAVTTDVLSNDTLGQAPYSLSVTTAPLHGTAVVTPTIPTTGLPQVLYTPAANFNGSDVYTYQVCNATQACATAQVTITVTAVNDPPVAVSDAYSTNEDTNLVVAAPGILGNDTDVDGDTLIVSQYSPTTNGSLVVNANGAFTYIPNLNFNGTDGFSYTASDGNGMTSTANVSITINPVNDLPVAAGDAATTAENVAVTVNVLANDTDADGDTVSLDSFDATSAHNGTIVRVDNGTPLDKSDDKLLYTPATNYYGTDTFTYLAVDGKGGSAVGTVTITITHNAQAPIANNDSYTLDQNTTLNVPASAGVLNNDIDPDNQVLTVLVPPAQNPSHGSLVLSADGHFSYTPENGYTGTDTFIYKVKNQDNLQSNEATVTLTINVVNRAPNATDNTYAVDQDTQLTVTAENGVLANDSDPDGNLLTAILVSPPTHGTLNLSNSGSFVYNPVAGYVGFDTFTYKANDSKADSNIATVRIEMRDKKAPTVSWTLPITAGRFDVIGQIIHIEVQAEDNVGVTSVRFFRWDAVKGIYIDICTDTTAPFGCDLNTKVLNAGWNQIFAKSYDAAGNASVRSSIFLYRDDPSPRLYLPMASRLRTPAQTASTNSH